MAFYCSFRAGSDFTILTVSTLTRTTRLSRFKIYCESLASMPSWFGQLQRTLSWITLPSISTDLRETPPQRQLADVNDLRFNPLRLVYMLLICAQLKDRLLALTALKHRSNSNAQSFGDCFNRIERRIAFSAFDAADVCAVKPHSIGERLLRHPSIKSQLSHPTAK